MAVQLYTNLEIIMIKFFNTIAANFFTISLNLFHSWGSKENREIAKIQTVFVLTVFQSINLFFILVNPILAKYYCYAVSKNIIIIVSTIFLINNYYNFIIKSRLERLSSNKPLFFKNQSVTYLIIVLYFILSAFLMWRIGDFVRNQILNNC